MSVILPPVENNERFSCTQEIPDKPEFSYAWDGSSPLVIEELSLLIEAAITKRPGSFEFDDKVKAYLDAENIQFPLQIRNRRDGDRYQPLGAPGRKKLKEIMRAKSIPLEEREKKPVFISGNEIIWVLGFPVAEKFRIHEKTKKVVVLTVGPRDQR